MYEGPGRRAGHPQKRSGRPVRPSNDYGGFVRRLSAGRTYSSTVVFDIPSTKGDIVFVYPLLDVAASWKIG